MRAVGFALLVITALFASWLPQVRAEEAIVGTWKGTVDQVDSASYPTVMKITSATGGTIDYPTLNCGGTVSGSGAGARYKFIERIKQGGTNCIDAGTIRIVLTGPNTMKWEWTGFGYRATATLRRDRPAVAQAAQPVPKSAAKASPAQPQQQNTEVAATAAAPTIDKSTRASVATRELPDIRFGNYHALVIGNNDYAFITDLKTAANDAQAVAEILRRDYEFDVNLLVNATRAEVLRALADYRRTLRPDDNLLVYYAGHGVLDDVTERGYWLPVDAEEDVPTNWISNTDVTDMLKAIRAQHVMVVADSCYSGTLTRSAPANLATSRERDAWLKRVVRKRSRTALASGGLEPVTDSGGGAQHSYFAKAFLTALRENDAVLEGHGLFERVKRPVVLNTRQTPRYDDIRDSGHEGGDFLFVRTAQPATPTQAKGTKPPSSTPSAEIVFWQSIQDSNDPAMFRAYLQQFPNGTFASIARIKLKAME